MYFLLTFVSYKTGSAYKPNNHENRSGWSKKQKC